MANWCSCGITFYSENKEALAQFARLFNEIHEGQSTEENGFGHGWMGDYANIFYPNINAKNIDCKGYIDYMDSSIKITDKQRKKFSLFFYKTIRMSVRKTLLSSKEQNPSIFSVFLGNESKVKNDFFKLPGNMQKKKSK